MRAVVAKRIRKSVGFHPADNREYRQLGNRIRSTNDGEIKRFAGTIVATGALRSYQASKKAMVAHG